MNYRPCGELTASVQGACVQGLHAQLASEINHGYDVGIIVYDGRVFLDLVPDVYISW